MWIWVKMWICRGKMWICGQNYEFEQKMWIWDENLILGKKCDFCIFHCLPIFSSQTPHLEPPDLAYSNLKSLIMVPLAEIPDPESPFLAPFFDFPPFLATELGSPPLHGVWKSQKKSHSTLRAKRATITFWVDKSLLKMPKMVQFWRVFWKPEACGQTVLPDRSVLIGQKLAENAKIQMRLFGWFSNTVPLSAFSSIFLIFSWSSQRKES